MFKMRFAGFTLVESIVTIAIMTIIAFSVMHIMTEGFRVWAENRNFIELRADARTALDRISSEFREAEVINQITANSLDFDSDIYDDGDRRRITYSFNGGRLVRSVVGEPGLHTLCGNVSGVVFTWTSPTLTLDLTLSRGGDTVMLRTVVMARCMP